MIISVAICTWNRAKLLDQTLAQMCNLRIPDGVEWELLVVDNNCTDETQRVISKYTKQLPLRALFEPKQGQSNSRNCAIDAARGELLIWTDDDVLVDEDWLAEYARACDAQPESSFFGGPVLPWFEGERPQWLTTGIELVQDAFAIRDFGRESYALPGTTGLPFGANFALRTEIQRQYRYDPQRGRIGQGMMSGDETDVLSRMVAGGHSGRWIPTAKVRHFIPRERQTTRYLRRYYCGHGELSARTKPMNGGAKLFGRPRWLLRAVLASELKYRWHRTVSPSNVWIGCLKQASVYRGMFRGYGR